MAAFADPYLSAHLPRSLPLSYLPPRSTASYHRIRLAEETCGCFPGRLRRFPGVDLQARSRNHRSWPCSTNGTRHAWDAVIQMPDTRRYLELHLRRTAAIFSRTTMPPWALVSPASRGIGHALTRHILRTTTVPVVATARRDLERTKDELLRGLDVDASRLDVLQLDVLDEKSIEAAAEHCRSQVAKGSAHLHLSFIIPGLLFPEKSPRQIDHDHALLTFRTNTLGPLLMMKHFSPFLPTKKTKLSIDPHSGLPSAAVMAFMSARVGSISDNRLGGWYSYRASKAAVNQIVKTFDNHLTTTAGENAMAVGLHPGTVKTGLSKDFWGSVSKEKLFEPTFSAERLVEVVRGLGTRGRGKCWDWDGKEVPP